MSFSKVDRLLVATRNLGKVRELEHLLTATGITVVPLSEHPEVPEVEEDADTFEGNAVKKAAAAAAASGMPALADDSGLVVDILDGRPGVHSARFSGPGATDASNNAKLLRELKETGAERPRARFRSVVALCLPDGGCVTFDGTIEGEILDAPRGEGGFGYDPLFFVPEEGRTMAELPLETKNRLSHRGVAFGKLRAYLESVRGE